MKDVVRLVEWEVEVVAADLREEDLSRPVRRLFQIAEQAVLPQHGQRVAPFSEELARELHGHFQILPVEAILADGLNQGSQVIDQPARELGVAGVDLLVVAASRIGRHSARSDVVRADGQLLVAERACHLTYALTNRFLWNLVQATVSRLDHQLGQLVSQDHDVPRQQSSVTQEVLKNRLPDLTPAVLDEWMTQPVVNLGRLAFGLAQEQALLEAGHLPLEEEFRARVFPTERGDVRLPPVSVLMLPSQHRGEYVIAHADDDMQAPTEVLIPEEAHGAEEEPRLALQPVHGGTRVLLVDGIDEEVDGGHRRDDVVDRRGELRPRRIVEVLGKGMGGMERIDDLGLLAVDRDLPPALGDDLRDIAFELIAVGVRQVGGELLRVQEVRDQRAHDGAVPELHPFLGQVLPTEALTELDDVVRGREILLDDVRIDRFVLRCSGSQPSQVDGLAG